MKLKKSIFVIVFVALSVGFATLETVTGANPNLANTLTSAPSRIRFKVKMDNLEFGFSEMNGSMIDQPNNNNQGSQNKSMPGIKKTANVTLKKGVFQGDKSSFDKFSNSLKSTPKKTTITISMLDEAGKVTKTWTLTNAYAIKMVANNEIAIESLDIAYEGLK